MKKLAIIGASYLQQPLVEKCKELGVYSICFAWEEGAVCKDVCDKFYPISTVDKEAILKVCQEEKIDGITTIASDVATLTVSYVAEKMGLPQTGPYESVCIDQLMHCILCKINHILFLCLIGILVKGDLIFRVI